MQSNSACFSFIWLIDFNDICFVLFCRRFFGLSFCESLTDQSLLYVQNMVNLVSLRLKKGSEFSGEALKELFVQLHPERTGNPTGLLHITVAECTNLNDAALHALAERYSCKLIILGSLILA